jgi:hypothetical protein
VIALAVDENFDHHVLRALVRRVPDLDFCTVQQAGLAGANDLAVLEWAAREGRVLLTHDVRTVTKFAYERIERGDIVPGVIEVPSRASVSDVLDDLELVITCATDDDLRDRVLFVPLR